MTAECSLKEKMALAARYSSMDPRDCFLSEMTSWDTGTDTVGRQNVLPTGLEPELPSLPNIDNVRDSHFHKFTTVPLLSYY